MKINFKSIGIATLTFAIVFVMAACTEENSVDNSKFYLDPPTGISVSMLSDNRTVHLTWNAVSGADRYEICLRSNLDSTDTRINVTTTSNTVYEHYWDSYWYYGYFYNRLVRQPIICTSDFQN